MENTSDVRKALLNSLTQVTHRDLKPLVDIYAQALVADPFFASRALVYVALNSKINDQVMAAIVALLQADPEFPEFRGAGRALVLGNDVYNIAHPNADRFNGLAPFRIIRLMNYIHSSDKPIARLARQVVMDWVDMLQKDLDRLEGVVISNRKHFKNLIKNTYHIKVDDYLKKLLFTNEPPAGSKVAILKKIAQETDKTKRARLIIENKIPYRVAASLLGQVDVQTAIALLAVMTPQEALNSRSFLEQSGAFELPEVKAEYLKKIQKATGSAATVTNRKSVKGNDAEINAALDTVANKAAQKGLRIKNPVTVFVDISGSLAASIAWSKEVLARLAAASDDVIKVVLYRDSASELSIDQWDLTGITKAMKGVVPSGGTRLDVALRYAAQKNFSLSNILLLTDSAENNPNSVVQWMRDYIKSGNDINLTLVRVPGQSPTVTAKQYEDLGCRVQEFVVNDFDPYVADMIPGWFAGEKTMTLIDLIADTPLPTILGKK